MKFNLRFYLRVTWELTWEQLESYTWWSVKGVMLIERHKLFQNDNHVKIRGFNCIVDKRINFNTQPTCLLQSFDFFANENNQICAWQHMCSNVYNIKHIKTISKYFVSYVHYNKKGLLWKVKSTYHQSYLLNYVEGSDNIWFK